MPPPSGVFAQPWSLKKIVGLLAVFGPAAIVNFELPAAYRTRPPMLAGAIVSAVILVAFAGISGWGLAGKLFGI